MKMADFFLALFRADPNKKPTPDPVGEELQNARREYRSASQNLQATLEELLNESDRLRLRPIYVAGPLRLPNDHDQGSRR
jgi:hypothetical protein